MVLRAQKGFFLLDSFGNQNEAYLGLHLVVFEGQMGALFWISNDHEPLRDPQNLPRNQLRECPNCLFQSFFRKKKKKDIRNGDITGTAQGLPNPAS